MENFEVTETPNQSEPNWYSRMYQTVYRRRIYQTLYRRRMLILAICGVLLILVVILCTTYIPKSSMEVAAMNNIIKWTAFTSEG